MPRMPKHSSVRARRNDPKKDFRTLALQPSSFPVPRWPLPQDASMVAKLETARDAVARLQADMADEEDGRKLARMRRQLASAEIVAATVEIQLQQAADGEQEMWAEMWAMPQATVWLETHSQRAVAQYVRLKIQAEQGNLAASTEARQWSDRLGLNPLALFRLRVEIEHAEDAQAQADARRQQQNPTDPEGVPQPKPGDGDDPRNGLYAVS